jgi:hypothetical protein
MPPVRNCGSNSQSGTEQAAFLAAIDALRARVPARSPGTRGARLDACGLWQVRAIAMRAEEARRTGHGQLLVGRHRRGPARHRPAGLRPVGPGLVADARTHQAAAGGDDPAALRIDRRHDAAARQRLVEAARPVGGAAQVAVGVAAMALVAGDRLADALGGAAQRIERAARARLAGDVVGLAALGMAGAGAVASFALDAHRTSRCRGCPAGRGCWRRVEFRGVLVAGGVAHAAVVAIAGVGAGVTLGREAVHDVRGRRHVILGLGAAHDVAVLQDEAQLVRAAQRVGDIAPARSGTRCRSVRHRSGRRSGSPSSRSEEGRAIDESADIGLLAVHDLL